jgi:hypothetical protein
MYFNNPLNLFYSEPDPDRWFKYDRYPRKIIRQLVRGRQRPGGVAMVAINLMKGLDKLGVPYRFNDFRYIKTHPDEIACIIGKPHVILDRKWQNPVIFGAGVYSHPVECPTLFTKYPNVKKILVPGEWMRKMFEPYYHDQVLTWPVGIDTNLWSPAIKSGIKTDFLIYDKVRWEHDKYETELINPICRELNKRSLSYEFIRYGNYSPQELIEKLKHSGNVLFLCEHETQGLAYQQILATNTPILAWDRGGHWQDPYYYPKIKFGPVSSVPYWDERCGIKFKDAQDFGTRLDEFMSRRLSFSPRSYIEETLTLEKCAQAYLDIYKLVASELN